MLKKKHLDYFVWEGHFDCSQTIRDLDGTGIDCPDLFEGLPKMVQFYLENKDNHDYHITIR